MEVRSVRTALIAQLGDSVDISRALLSGPLTITDFITADGIMMRLDGATTSRGSTPTAEETTAVIGALRSRGDTSRSSPRRCPSTNPDLPALAPTFVGMLAIPIPIPIGGDGDYVAWFRDELIHSIHWLGGQTAANRLTPLSPRNSFTSWSETVTGTAAAWDGVETDAAGLGLDLSNALLRRAEPRLALVTMHDPLTGLPNRRQLTDRLEHALARYLCGIDLAVLFIDLDRFKNVNDSHGHNVGDAVLIRTALPLLATARAEDTVARIGGDEFIFLCEDTTVENAEIIADRVLAALRATARSSRPGEPTVTASIGITSADFRYTAPDLLRKADGAMYRAKARGGDQLSR